MATMATDIRLAVRLLRRDPLFAALAVFMLASGLTGALLVFSLANAVLLRPLPYAGAKQLVVVTDRYQRAAFPAFSPTVPEILDLRAGTRAFSEIAFIDHRDVQVRGRAEPERVYVGRASLNFFTLLGVQPLLGRTFDERDARTGESQVVILSHALWRRLYNADPQVVGQAITVNGNAGTIIGVLPPTFAFDHATLGIPEAVDIYTSFPNDDDYTTRAGSYANVRRVIALARLKPGITLDQARADCERIARQLVNDYRRLYVGPKGEDYGFSMTLAPLSEAIVGSSRSSLLLLLAAVGLMLAIACANTAGLLLTKAIARRPELAVRAALGASRWRLVRQFLAESLVLAAASGLLGLLFTAWLLPLAIRLGATRIPRIEEASIDGRVLLFAAALSLVTAMLFGLLPAMQSRTESLIAALTTARKGTLSAAARSRLRPALVIAQIALSVMLLVGAGLLTRSLMSLQQLPLGFSPERILTLRLSLPYYAYSGRGNPSVVYEEMRRRLLAVPGVESAAMSTAIPAREGQTASIAIAGKPNDLADRARRLAVTQLVSPDYFETLASRRSPAAYSRWETMRRRRGWW
jgi:predicted permease